MSERAASDEPKHPIQVVSRRTGLSADVLRVWEKRYRAVSPGRSGTRRRLYSDDDVERLLLLRRATLGGRRIGSVAGLSTAELRRLVAEDEAAAAAAPRSESAPPVVPGSQLAHALEAAHSLDGDRLEASLTGAAVALGPNALIDDVVVPLLRTIGDEWRDGKARVFQEHLTTAVVRSLLGTLRTSRPTGDGAPDLIATTPSGQTHEMGALMAAVVAASEGWRVTYLGPDLPAEEIAAAALQRDARAVALSVIYPGDDPRLFDELNRLRRLVPEGVALLVGGGGSGGVERRVPGVRHVPDYPALRRELEGLRRS